MYFYLKKNSKNDWKQSLFQFSEPVEVQFQQE